MEKWKEERIGIDLDAAKNTVARGVLDVNSSFENLKLQTDKKPRLMVWVFQIDGIAYHQAE